MQETATMPALIADKLATLPGIAQVVDQHERTSLNGKKKTPYTINPSSPIEPKVALAMYDPKWQP